MVSDEDYGDQSAFLDHLEQRSLRYVMAIRRDFTVRVTPESPSLRAETLVAAQPKRAWRTIGWRESSAGRLRALCGAALLAPDRHPALGRGLLDWRTAAAGPGW